MPRSGCQKGVLSLRVVRLPVRDPLSAGHKTSPRAKASKPQDEVNFQTAHHRPRDKSNMTIREVSVRSQGCMARPPGDRVRGI